MKRALHWKTVSAKITKHRIAKGIYLLRFENQYQLAATFLRVQEHYESPRFHGRIFTLEQYMDWYVARYGSFSYYQDWSGFNVPSTAFQPFYDGKFDPLTEKEKRLLGLFKGLRERFYVIGIYGHGQSLTHELAHALFFVDTAYREAVRKAMRGYNTSRLEKQLADAGYARHVIPDEVQAYLVAPSGALGAASRPLEPLRRKLRALFRQHSKGLSIPKIK
jgi:hypothetical protein